jgi:hypothetical protein
MAHGRINIFLEKGIQSLEDGYFSAAAKKKDSPHNKGAVGGKSQ